MTSMRSFVRQVAQMGHAWHERLPNHGMSETNTALTSQIVPQNINKFCILEGVILHNVVRYSLRRTPYPDFSSTLAMMTCNYSL